MPCLNKLADKYHKAVTFVFVYIEEAHAVDEWPFPGINEFLEQHRTMQDRLTAAKCLLNEFPFSEHIHVVLDDMENSYNRVYSSWPFRYYIVDGDRVVLKEMPQGDTLSLVALTNWLGDLKSIF